MVPSQVEYLFNVCLSISFIVTSTLNIPSVPIDCLWGVKGIFNSILLQVIPSFKGQYKTEEYNNLEVLIELVFLFDETRLLDYTFL